MQRELTQWHTDLRNEFFERVKVRRATPDVEVRLRERIGKLREGVVTNTRK